jgi:hypothetical protein
MAVGDDGNLRLGVGTTNSLLTLSVGSSSTDIGNTGSSFKLQARSMLFQTYGTNFPNLFIGASGNVGIATSDVSGKYALNIGGTINALSYYMNGTLLGTLDAGTTDGQTLYWSASANKWTFTNNLFIAQNGYVGIGTSNPQSQLDIAGLSSRIANTSGDLIFDTAGEFNFSGKNVKGVNVLSVGGSICYNSHTGTTDTSGCEWSAPNTKLRQITLSPEYPNAVLTKYYDVGTSDTNTAGNLRSDYEKDQENKLKNYYKWESTSGSSGAQCYTIATRYVLPADFGSWVNGVGYSAIEIKYTTQTNDSVNNFLDIRLANIDSTTIPAISNVVSSIGTSWFSTYIPSYTLADNNTWNTANQSATFYLRLCSNSQNYTKVGDIVLNYLSKW